MIPGEGAGGTSGSEHGEKVVVPLEKARNLTTMEPQEKKTGLLSPGV